MPKQFQSEENEKKYNKPESEQLVSPPRYELNFLNINEKSYSYSPLTVRKADHPVIVI